MISQELRSAISTHALEEYPRECCGVIVAGKYHPCVNIAPNPLQDFQIHPEDYADAEDAGEITAVVHSHPGSRAQPSHSDLVYCEGAGIPLWVIVSLGGQRDGSIGIDDWYEFGPTGYEAPLIGCEFSHGTNDCYGLVRRYYKQTHGVVLPDFQRPDRWWEDGSSDLYTQNFGTAGFYALPSGTEPEPGDVLLMKIRSRNNVPNHAAVYIGDGWFIHHLWGELSRRDQLMRYLPRVTHVLRFKEATWNHLEQSASTAS